MKDTIVEFIFNLPVSDTEGPVAYTTCYAKKMGINC